MSQAKQSRFIASVLKTAKSAGIITTWARGARRSAMIARRKQDAQTRQTA